MTPKIQIQHYKTPVGELILGDFEGKICLCDWKYRKMRSAIDKRIQSYTNATYQTENTPVLTQTMEQLEAYFAQKLHIFQIPLLFIGTAFQQTVWQQLQRTNYGTTATYLQLSQSLNNVKAIRAVASANGANAISIIVPCHRIVGSNGSLVGYAGGLPAKKKLLQLEGSMPKNEQILLF